jgi:glyoxylase-like metal-dependent hydrolase (beta-lactamase superfamily II)
MQYQWAILQDGQLPLKVDGRVTREPHLCTVTLIWPQATTLSPANSLIVDPCFSEDTIDDAETRLQQVDASLDRIGHFLETYGHFDHKLLLPRGTSARKRAGVTKRRTSMWKPLSENREAFPGVEMISCLGHAVDLQMLSFRGANGVVCVASDAILNREWLLVWQYYWPNVYAPAEIIETWRSLGNILTTADTVIPGHSPPISVTAELLRELINRFPRAEYGSRCLEVVRVLNQRLNEL